MEKPKLTSVDAYIAAAPEEVRSLLEELRAAFRSAVPDAEEKISYGVPFYTYHGQFGGFAAYAKHVSVGLDSEAYAPGDRERLEEMGYKTGKGTFQIQFDQPIPKEMLNKLLKQKKAYNEVK